MTRRSPSWLPGLAGCSNCSGSGWQWTDGWKNDTEPCDQCGYRDCVPGKSSDALALLRGQHSTEQRPMPQAFKG